jgi:recombinational DNA repair ATPase RecF
MTQTARPAPAIYALTIERFRGITSLKWKPSRGVNVIIGGSDVGKTTYPERRSSSERSSSRFIRGLRTNGQVQSHTELISLPESRRTRPKNLLRTRSGYGGGLPCLIACFNICRNSAVS